MSFGFVIAAPNKMPLKFRVVLIGPDYVDLEWDAIVLDRGSVDGYKVCIVVCIALATCFYHREPTSQLENWSRL